MEDKTQKYIQDFKSGLHSTWCLCCKDGNAQDLKLGDVPFRKVDEHLSAIVVFTSKESADAFIETQGLEYKSIELNWKELAMYMKKHSPEIRKTTGLQVLPPL